MSSYRIEEVGALGLSTEDVVSFIGREWKREVVLERSAFYRWQFKATPEAGGIDRSLVVLDDKNSVIGFMGVTPRPFYLENRRCEAAELTTWVISEAARGQGLGKQIVARLQGTYEAILGLGVTDFAQRIYIPAGIRYFRYIPRFIRIYDLMALGALAKAERLGERLVEQYAAVATAPPYDVTAVTAAKLAAYVEAPEKSFNCLSREPDYMRWRYDEHPIYRHEAYLIECDGHKAGLVVRREDKDGVVLLHLLEAFGNPAALPSAVAQVDRLAADAGAAAADFYCTSYRITSQFWAAGWFSAVDDDSMLRVAHLLYPVELRSPATKSLILWSRHDMSAMLNLGNLYFTKGDCDFDRPTGAYIAEKEIAP